MTGPLKVNFSDDEASSEALDFDPIPAGKYHAIITGIKTQEIKSTEKGNQGKPFWNVELTIQPEHDKYAGRKLWTNVMLFDGALYTLSQLLKATGNGQVIKTGKIPSEEVFLSKDVLITVSRQRDTYRMADDPDGDVIFKNEVRGFKSWSDQVADAEKSGSLLPS